jgi:hypothetical protein
MTGPAPSIPGAGGSASRVRAVLIGAHHRKLDAARAVLAAAGNYD